MTRRPWMFVLGVAVLVGSVVGPLESESAQHFFVHMIQHMIVVLIASPLIAASGVITVRGKLLGSLFTVGLLHALALWLWHLPALYDAAMEHDALHVLEHASFLVTAVLFWRVVMDEGIDRFKRIGLVFITMLQSGALGAVIAFAGAPLYEWHVLNTPGDAMQPSRVLEEQQLAGAIMWVPPGVVYLAVMVALLARALAAFDAAEQR